MREFDELKKIVGKLTEEEFRFELEGKCNGKEKKSYYMKLIGFVREYPESSEQETQRSLYNTNKTIAFKQLVRRSKDKLLDLLLQKDSIDNSPYYDERAKEIFVLRKRLIQFDILCLRGLNDISIKLINKIILKSKLYEYYDILVFALYKKLRITGAYTTQEEYQYQIKEIGYYEDCRTSFHKSELYHKSLYDHVNEKKKLLDQQNKLEKIILELEADVVRTNSKTTLYHLLIIKAEHFNILDKQIKCYKIWNEIVSLVSNNKYLKSSHALGMAFMNLGVTNLHLLRFEASNHAFKKAIQMIKMFDPNTSIIINYQFLLAFYNADSKSIETYSDILNSYLYSGVIVHYAAARVRYYNACLKFIQNDYTSSYLLLQDVKDLEQEKESWNISIRILAIMNQVELEHFEVADSLIENLRKHHERVRKTLPITKRDELIIQVLSALSRHSYNFRKTYRLKEAAFNRLNSLEIDYRWKILSPEMVIFHEWFTARKKDKKYDHFEVMEIMKEKFSSLHKSFVPLAADAESPSYN